MVDASPTTTKIAQAILYIGESKNSVCVLLPTTVVLFSALVNKTDGFYFVRNIVDFFIP